jgi:hypothetical protein
MPALAVLARVGLKADVLSPPHIHPNTPDSR